jgi:hypothetical protein
LREVIAATVFASMLAGCSDIYYDRRETVAFGGGDSVATNRTIHMIDPWPRHSGDRNLVFNGERMQRAVECYRADKVTTPPDQDTEGGAAQGSQAAVVNTCQGKMSSSVVQPAIVMQSNGQTGNSSTVVNKP